MKREREIDIANGIAILLVVIGHSYSSQDIVRQLINAFHMPFSLLLVAFCTVCNISKAEGKLLIAAISLKVW